MRAAAVRQGIHSSFHNLRRSVVFRSPWFDVVQFVVLVALLVWFMSWSTAHCLGLSQPDDHHSFRHLHPGAGFRRGAAVHEHPTDLRSLITVTAMYLLLTLSLPHRLESPDLTSRECIDILPMPTERIKIRK